jgi:prepilin-type N-terminal cleavage/methylation domain-containing protein
MTALINRARRIRASRDGGFTLIELLVAMTLSLVVGSILMSTLIVAQKSMATSSAVSDMNGEARVLLNRLSGDLRQALPVFTLTGGSEVETPAITAVQNAFPGGTSGALTSITFNADYNGDGCIAGVTSDNGCNPAKPVDANCNGATPNATCNPETETFCWDPAVQKIYLVPGALTSGCQGTAGAAEPLLSGQVTDLQVWCNSSSYLYDESPNGGITPPDGVTTWKEIDDQLAPIGTGSGTVNSGTRTTPSTAELAFIDSIVIVVTVQESGHTRTYQTLVSLRNVS